MTRKDITGLMRLIWNVSEGRVAIAALLMIAAGLIEGLSLVLLIPIAAAASPDGAEQIMQIPVLGGWLAQATPDLGVLLVAFVCLIAFQAFLNRTKSLYNNQIMIDASDRLRMLLFRTVCIAHWSAIAARRGSDINHVLSTDTQKIVTTIGLGLVLFQSVVMLCIYMILAALVSWQMAVFATLVGLLLFGMLYPIRRRAATYGKDMLQMLQDQNHTVLEFITSIRLAKLFTIEQRHAEAYSQHLKSIRQGAIDYLSVSTWGTLLFQVGAAIIAASFVWVSIKIFALDITRIGVLLFIFVRLAPRFNGIQDSTQQLLNNAPAYTNYTQTVEYFAKNREVQQHSVNPAPSLTRDIKFEAVNVAFPGSSSPSLDGVSLTIGAGRITALIGPSGSGKSTLADILLGLTRPDQGAVRVDDVALDEENRRAWRSSVACVPQDAFLLNDTIAANLRVGRADASDDELWETLNRSNIGDLIRTLPNGLNTMAGDRGMRFSGGERQRLALARALLRKPQLLVLDEATSALDWENQAIIAAAIEALRGELTIVTIAHRPSLITFADDVIALDAGRVIAQGTYADMKNDPSSPLSRMLVGDGAL